MTQHFSFTIVIEDGNWNAAFRVVIVIIKVFLNIEYMYIEFCQTVGQGEDKSACCIKQCRLLATETHVENKAMQSTRNYMPSAVKLQVPSPFNRSYSLQTNSTCTCIVQKKHFTYKEHANRRLPVQ